MATEDKVTSPLYMDRSEPLGNSLDDAGRRALHVKPQGGATSLKGYTVGRITYQLLTHTAWTAAPVVPLPGRRSLLLQNNTQNHTVLWNYTNDPAVTVGYEIEPGGIKEVSVESSLTVYLRLKGGGNSDISIIIEELG